MVGPIIGGFVAGHFGINTSFIVNSFFLVALSFIIWKKMEEPRKQFVESLEFVESRSLKS